MFWLGVLTRLGRVGMLVVIECGRTILSRCPPTGMPVVLSGSSVWLLRSEACLSRPLSSRLRATPHFAGRTGDVSELARCKGYAVGPPRCLGSVWPGEDVDEGGGVTPEVVECGAAFGLAGP